MNDQDMVEIRWHGRGGRRARPGSYRGEAGAPR